MATQKFIEYPNGPRGVTLTRRAEATIAFGKLVMKGTASDQVLVATAATDKVLGIAKPDAVIEDTNDAEQYNAADVVQVETLIPGQVYYAYANGAITQDDYIEASTGGDVATATGHTHTENTAGAYTQNATTAASVHNRVLGIALEAAADNAWFKFLAI